MNLQWLNISKLPFLYTILWSIVLRYEDFGGNCQPFSPRDQSSSLNPYVESTNPQSSSCMYRKSQAISQEGKHLNDSIEGLVFCMKTFIHQTYFDAVEFELHIQWFESELSEIMSAYENLESLKEKHETPIGFVRHMFQVMVTSSIYMNYLTSHGQYGDNLAIAIIEFNVMVFSLFDYKGEPYRYKSEYFKEVTQLEHSLNVWKQAVKTFGELPKAVQMILVNQEAEAEHSLEILKSNIL